jgi:hypothetical protein
MRAVASTDGLRGAFQGCVVPYEPHAASWRLTWCRLKVCRSKGLPRTEGEHQTFREENRLRSIRDSERKWLIPVAYLTP